LKKENQGDVPISFMFPAHEDNAELLDNEVDVEIAAT
jgi:hypothetical protein